MANNTPQNLEVYKDTSSLGRLLIKPVDKPLAKEMIVKNHYSHKWNDGGFGVYNFGIFHAAEPDRCLGVAVYGYMKNPAARIFTHPNPKAWMCELNRMWIDDELGHNAESILIAASIKLLRRLDPNLVAVQSFADGRLGWAQSIKPPTSNITAITSQNFCATSAAASSFMSRYSQIHILHPAFFAPM